MYKEFWIYSIPCISVAWVHEVWAVKTRKMIGYNDAGEDRWSEGGHETPLTITIQRGEERQTKHTHTHPSTPDSHRDTQNNIMLCECVRGGGSGGSRAAAFENGVTLWSAVFLGRNSNYCMFVQWGAPYVVQQSWLMFHSELTQSIQLFDGIFFLFFLQMQNI